MNQRRIDRCKKRLKDAICPKWQQAWRNGLKAAESAHKAIEGVQVVRSPPTKRALAGGSQVLPYEWAPDSGMDSTTTFVGSASRASRAVFSEVSTKQNAPGVVS
jgi:hypothetical protein